MKLESIELHDAIINSFSINYEKMTAVISIEYYTNKNECGRVSGQITFSGIESINQVVDISELSKHRKFGNISYWSPAKGMGATFIHLCTGTISVTAKKVSFKKLPKA